MNSTPHDTPTPAAFEGCFWLNCAAAFCRAQVNVAQFKDELCDWKKASDGLLGSVVSEAFWSGFTPGITVPNLNPTEQLRKALGAAVLAASQLAGAAMSGFVRIPSVRGADLLLRGKTSSNLFLKFIYNELTTVAQFSPNNSYAGRK